MGEPLQKNEAIFTSIFVSITIIICYGLAFGIWGIVFSRSFITFSLYGSIAGLLISLLFITPIIAKQKTKKQMKNIIFSVDMMWTSLGIIIGVIGLIVWFITALF